MAAVVMHRFSVLAAPSVRSQGTVLGGVFTLFYCITRNASSPSCFALADRSFEVILYYLDFFF